MALQRRVFLDTDIGQDCDDAAALALAVLYCRKEQAKLIGVTHCTSSPYGVGAIHAVLNWYKEPNVPVGTLQKAGFLTAEQFDRYGKALSRTVSPAQRTAPDAQKVMRDVLSREEDHSVEMIGIGPLVNFAALIADAEGYELVSRKVKRLTLMGGDFSGADKPEWNILCDVAAARKVSADWPSEIVFCGFEVGDVVVALKEPTPLRTDNPVKTAYGLAFGGVGRNSWDLCTVQWAIQSGCGHYALSEGGVVSVDDRGVTTWRKDAAGSRRYLILQSRPNDVAEGFERELFEYDACMEERS